MRTLRTAWVIERSENQSGAVEARREPDFNTAISLRTAHTPCEIESGVVAGELASALERVLSSATIPGPRRVAGEIIAALLDEPRSWLSLHRDARLDGQVATAAHIAASRMAAGAPFAYCVGRVQFRHLTLEVDPRVLIPRPETEVLVDEILSRFRSIKAAGADWGVAVDIGTGSGAIALSLASEGSFARVVGTDNSLDAIDVARKNAANVASALRCPVEFRCGSLVAPIQDLKARLIVSNPPYVAFGEARALPESVRNWEPPTALLSGSLGLDATAAIVQGSESSLESGGILALEVDERRASQVADMLMSNAAYIDVGVCLDLTGRERFVFASRA